MGSSDLRIELLEMPSFIALRRNEVKGRVPGTATLNKWMSGKEKPEPLWADSDDETTGRTQRQTMALKNVRYRLTAKIIAKREFAAEYGTMNAQFERRARAGKCFQQPYFGCREFPAFFEYLGDSAANSVTPAHLDQHLGFMLYDVFDLSREVVKDGDKPFITLFDATLVGGVLEVPPFESAAVKKPGRV